MAKKMKLFPMNIVLNYSKRHANPKKHVCVDEAMHNNLYDFDIDREVINFNS